METSTGAVSERGMYRRTSDLGGRCMETPGVGGSGPPDAQFGFLPLACKGRSRSSPIWCSHTHCLQPETSAYSQI
eukprot:3378330-Rhodomonas_salina.1